MAASPPPLTDTERQGRLARITRIATELGFVGIVEYRHVYSRSGGAQTLMMGNKKLAVIQDEVKAALANVADDPIHWLEERIAAGKRTGSGTDVLESVKRVLERGTRKKKRRRAVGAKK